MLTLPGEIHADFCRIRKPCDFVRVAKSLTLDILQRYDSGWQDAIDSGCWDCTAWETAVPKDAMGKGGMMKVNRLIQSSVLLACLIVAGMTCLEASAAPLVAQPSLAPVVAPATIGWRHCWGCGRGWHRGWGYGYGGYYGGYAGMASYRPVYYGGNYMVQPASYVYPTSYYGGYGQYGSGYGQYGYPYYGGYSAGYGYGYPSYGYSSYSYSPYSYCGGGGFW